MHTTLRLELPSRNKWNHHESLSKYRSLHSLEAKGEQLSTVHFLLDTIEGSGPGRDSYNALNNINRLHERTGIILCEGFGPDSPVPHRMELGKGKSIAFGVSMSQNE